VAEVNPDLVLLDPDGKPFTVRYDAVNAMLLNEFLKEHKKVEEQSCKMREQEATIAELKSGVKTLAATVKEQAAQIQKVSARISAGKPAPQVVSNNP
jgi:methyl-accepting chemotaxis protein